MFFRFGEKNLNYKNSRIIEARGSNSLSLWHEWSLSLSPQGKLVHLFPVKQRPLFRARHPSTRSNWMLSEDSVARQTLAAIGRAFHHDLEHCCVNRCASTWSRTWSRRSRELTRDETARQLATQRWTRLRGCGEPRRPVFVQGESLRRVSSRFASQTQNITSLIFESIFLIFIFVFRIFFWVNQIIV